jgi:hypothetical protein
LPTRSSTASRVEQTHLGRGGVGVGSFSMESFGGRCAGRGGFSSSFPSYEEEETRIGTKYGTNIEDESHAKLSSRDKIFSSNLTSLIIMISLE